jgi:hypothetical protein
MGLFPWSQNGWRCGVGRHDTPANIVKTTPEKKTVLKVLFG